MNFRNGFVKSALVFISVLLLLCFLIASFSACGNRAIIDPGNFDFKHVHVSDAVEGHCIDINKWWNNETGIEVESTGGDGIFLSEGTYQMFESSHSCPYCN